MNMTFDEDGDGPVIYVIITLIVIWNVLATASSSSVASG
jgi:hypothetical protein